MVSNIYYEYDFSAQVIIDLLSGNVVVACYDFIFWQDALYSIELRVVYGHNSVSHVQEARG